MLFGYKPVRERTFSLFLTKATWGMPVTRKEFARLDNKELSDDEVVKILKKLSKSEKEVLEHKGQGTESAFIGIIETYLPKMTSEAEIHDWIKHNIDFAQFKNKMQAMGSIMKHFGATADGNSVKKILQQM